MYFHIFKSYGNTYFIICRIQGQWNKSLVESIALNMSKYYTYKTFQQSSRGSGIYPLPSSLFNTWHYPQQHDLIPHPLKHLISLPLYNTWHHLLATLPFTRHYPFTLSKTWHNHIPHHFHPLLPHHYPSTPLQHLTISFPYWTPNIVVYPSPSPISNIIPSPDSTSDIVS